MVRSVKLSNLSQLETKLKKYNIITFGQLVWKFNFDTLCAEAKSSTSYQLDTKTTSEKHGRKL